MEGKAHILRKRNEDYAEAMETIERISRNYDQLEMDYNCAKEKCVEAECNVSRLSREREKLQKTISDLSRQVGLIVYFLIEKSWGNCYEMIVLANIELVFETSRALSGYADGLG